MKLIKGYAVLSQVELDKALKRAEERGAKAAGKKDKARVEELNKSLERKEKAVQQTHNELTDTKEMLEEYKSRADEVRKIAATAITNENDAALNQARHEALDKREAKLTDRLQEATTAEDHNYKKGYADGLSDGVRAGVASSAADRKSLTQIAMVSAASHTQPEVVNSALRITQGNTDGQTTKSA